MLSVYAQKIKFSLNYYFQILHGKEMIEFSLVIFYTGVLAFNIFFIVALYLANLTDLLWQSKSIFISQNPF
jgi:hypothetical protein